MRVLVELSDKLGDMVCDIALMRTIAERFPDSSIEVVCREFMSGVIEDCSFIHYRNFLSRGNVLRYLSTNARVARGNWDAHFQACDESGIEVARLAMRVPFTRGPEHRDANLAGEGMLVHRLSVLEGMVPNWRDSIVPGIPLLDSRLEHAMRVLGIAEGERVLTVAPGSSTGVAPWPIDSSVAAVEAISGTSFDRVLILGRAFDRDVCERLAERVSGTAVAGNLPLPYALALFNLSRLHVGTDSCMAHVAASFSVPTVCVGGQQDLYDRPWRQSMIPGRPEDIDPSEVAEMARKAMPS